MVMGIAREAGLGVVTVLPRGVVGVLGGVVLGMAGEGGAVGEVMLFGARGRFWYWLCVRNGRSADFAVAGFL